MTVGQRAARAVPVLMARQGALLGVTTVLGALVARESEPRVFALFGLVLVSQRATATIVDGGLTSGLIQAEEAPTWSVRREVLTAQLLLCLLGGLLVCLAALAAPPAFRAFILISAATAPLVALASFATAVHERELRYSRLALGTVLQSSTLYGIPLLTLITGRSPSMYFCLALPLSWAAFVSVALWRVPWFAHARPSLTLPGAEARRLLAYGSKMQISALVASVKDVAPYLMVATGLTLAAVGEVNFALTYATLPLLGLYALQRLYFPLFARLTEGHQLKIAVEHAVALNTAFVAPVSTALLVFAPTLIPIVYGQQWVNTIDLIVLFAVANLLIPIAVPAVALLNARGEVGLVLRYNALWGALAVLAATAGVAAAGQSGFAWIILLTQISNIPLIHRAVRRHCPAARVWYVSTWYWLLALACFLPTAVVASGRSAPATLLLVGLGTLIYALSCLAISWNRIGDFRRKWKGSIYA